MMKSEKKLILFLSFVAFALPVSNADENVTKSPTIVKAVVSESGSLVIPEAQPDPVKHADSDPKLSHEPDSSKKKELKDDQEHVVDVKEPVNTGIRAMMPDSFDISGSTGISVLLFVTSLMVVFFIMYRACRMKQNRGERRYGGVMTSYQELSPITIEDDDSEIEEQALFDINKARASQVVL